MLGAKRDQLNIRNPQLRPPGDLFVSSQRLRRSRDRTPKAGGPLQGPCVDSSVNAGMVLKDDGNQHAASTAEQEFGGI